MLVPRQGNPGVTDKERALWINAKRFALPEASPLKGGENISDGDFEVGRAYYRSNRGIMLLTVDAERGIVVPQCQERAAVHEPLPIIPLCERGFEGRGRGMGEWVGRKGERKTTETR